MRALFQKHRPLFIAGFIILFIAFWWAFRPDLLFVKKSVDEPLPGSTSYVQSQSFIALGEKMFEIA